MIKILKKLNRYMHDLGEKVGRRFDAIKKGPKAVVLTYHRVDNLDHDPLMLAVAPEHFDDQLACIKKSFDIISLVDLVDRLKGKQLKGNELAITFDDGYKDNLTKALPIAKKHGVPIAIFITSGIFDPAFSFPWDAEYGNGKGAYLSKEDAETLASDQLVTLGAHTRTHPRLQKLSEAVQKEEISSPHKFLAYPFGGVLDYGRATKKAAKEAGFKAAFATRDRIIMQSADLYALPRINVRDWSGKELVDRIKRYL